MFSFLSLSLPCVATLLALSDNYIAFLSSQSLLSFIIEKVNNKTKNGSSAVRVREQKNTFHHLYYLIRRIINYYRDNSGITVVECIVALHQDLSYDYIIYQGGRDMMPFSNCDSDCVLRVSTSSATPIGPCLSPSSSI